MGGRSGSKVRNAKRTKVSLTPKQSLFVAEFGKDWNATAAAKRAGYSKKTAQQIGSENLSKPVIWAAIKKVHEQRENDEVMSAQEVLKKLTIIGRTDLRAFYDDDGNPIPISKWTAEMGQQISKVESVVKNVAAGDGHVDQVLKVTAWDKHRSLEILSRYHSIMTPKVDVNVYLADQKALEAARPFIARAAAERKAFQAKHPELLAPRSRRPRETHVIEGELVTSDARGSATQRDEEDADR